jgi:hypothetical protein
MNTDLIVHLVHVLIFGTLFLYVGITKNKIAAFMYTILLWMGILVILYQAYDLYAEKGKKAWVNLIHILIIGPLLVYIGSQKEKTSRKFFELLLMLGFAVIGYHGYYIFFN